MAEAKSQVARRVLINVVAAYDPKVVNKIALSDSSEFIAFLAKDIISSGIDSFDYIDITLELEDQLDIIIPDTHFQTWQLLFNEIISLMNGD